MRLSALLCCTAQLALALPMHDDAATLDALSASPPGPANCGKHCKNGKHYQPAGDADDSGHCEHDGDTDTFCGCYEHEYYNTCQPCPPGTWMGDEHHRGTVEYCTPAPNTPAPPPPPCPTKCEPGYFFQPAADGAAQGLEDSGVENCLGMVPYDLYCGCFDYEYFNMCVPCPEGTWMGDGFHRGTIEYCTPIPGVIAPPPSASGVSYAPPTAEATARLGNQKALFGAPRRGHGSQTASGSKSHAHAKPAAGRPPSAEQVAEWENARRLHGKRAT